VKKDIKPEKFLPKPKSCMCKHCENYINEIQLSLETAVANLKELGIQVEHAKEIIKKQRKNQDFIESFVNNLGAYGDYIAEKQAFEEKEAINDRLQTSEKQSKTT
tara:strand:+ start:229 stop:543 length:315 start_codon:yes stop_codon:yes gene_type:complete